MPALGDRFRAAREARGLTLSDVAEQIRIRSVYLGAIEDENWASIGAPVYVRGFLRTYARFLVLDPQEAVAAFNASPETTATPAARAGGEGQAPQEFRRPGGLSPFIWVGGIVAALLVAFVAYNALTLSGRPSVGSGLTVQPGTTSAGATSPAPSFAPLASPVATTSPTPLAFGPNSIALHLSAPSWLRVTVDGSVSMEGTFPAGTTKVFHGKAALVRVGNAGGVQIFVDGKAVGPLGKSGDVVERSFIL